MSEHKSEKVQGVGGSSTEHVGPVAYADALPHAYFEDFDALEVRTPAWVSVLIGVCMINLGISVACFLLLAKLMQLVQ